ncbi:hypothetical protein TWF694_004421 [Orbilia ellipsospora]|uniref:Cytochrome P450 n=1 Tax=Orbilia ellipsospora TaxID=2528407 RepID=A0AAV9WW60_9PEZI
MLPGNGLPNTFSIIDKAHHSKRRRIFAYGFSEAALKSYEKVIQGHIDKFCQVLTKNADSEGWGQIVDMSKTCTGFALDTLGALAFSETFGALDGDKNSEYIFSAIVSAGRSMGVLIHLPIFGRSNFLFGMRWLFQRLILPLEDIKNIQNYLSLVAATAKRRRDREDTQARGIEKENSPEKDIFHYILRAKDPVSGEPFTPEELSAEARACIFAGTDTTSSTLAATLYWLSSAPEAFAKLQAELHSVFTSEDDIHTGSKLNSCLYLRRVVEEVLRISGPVGGILWREATKDHVIEGYRLPRGAEAGVAIYAIHHNPRYFPDPHVFNPDRWDDSIVGAQSVAIAKSAWMPFLTGPRSCIGRSLALMEIHLTIARIVFSYEMKMDESRLADLQVTVDDGYREFETKDQLAAETIGPFLQFRKSNREIC